MTKYYSQSSGLPFALSLLSLSPAPHPAQRSASEQLITIEEEIQLTNLSDDQDILQQNLVDLKRLKTRKITKAMMISQNQALKKENLTLSEKYQETRSALASVTLTLKEKQVDLKHYQNSNNDLNNSLKSLQKRKTILQLQLSKTYSQLQANKEEMDRGEKEITHLMSLQRVKDSQLIQIMHRNSQQIKDLRAQNKSVIQQYQSKQEETKKLLKKLNGINLQKEYKMKDELDQMRNSFEKVSEMNEEQLRLIEKLEYENRGLREQGKESQKRYQMELVSVRSEAERVGVEEGERKEREYRRVVGELKRENERKEGQIVGLEQKVRDLESHWRGIVEDKESQIKHLNDQIRAKQKTSQKISMQHQKEHNLLGSQLSLKEQVIEELELNNHQLSSKNQLLQTSMKQLYQETSSLEVRLLQLSKQRSLLSTETTNLRQQLRNTKEQLQQSERILSGKSMQLSRTQSQLNKVTTTLQKLTNQLVYFDKTNKQLQTQNHTLLQKDQQSRNANVQLRQILLQKQMTHQNLKDKYSKMQQFIQNYKTQGERIRETTEKKWMELRLVYEKQLDELEGKIKERERSYNELKLKMEVLERDNKIYEFESTVVGSGGGNSNLYHRF